MAIKSDVDQERLGQLRIFVDRYAQALREKGIYFNLGSFENVDELVAFMNTNTAYNLEIVEAWEAFIKGNVGEPEQIEPSPPYQAPQLPRNIPHIERHVTPEQYDQGRLNRDANQWEMLVKKGQEWEKKDVTYKGKKISEITNPRDFLVWKQHFSAFANPSDKNEISLNSWWYFRRHHVAYSWEKVARDFKDKRRPRGNDPEKIRLWEQNLANVGLSHIDTEEKFLAWQKAAPSREKVTLEMFRVGQPAHKRWQESTKWQNLLNNYGDQNTDLRDNDPDTWRKNLKDVGIQHLQNDEEFIAWQKADRKRKNLTIQMWRAMLPFALSYDEESMSVEQEVHKMEIAERVTQAPTIDRNGLPIVVYGGMTAPQTNKPYTPPPAAEFSNPREMARKITQILMGGYGGLTIPTDSDDSREQSLSQEAFDKGSQAVPLERATIPEPFTSNVEPSQDNPDTDNENNPDNGSRPSRPQIPGGVNTIRRLTKVGSLASKGFGGGGFLAVAIETAPVWIPVLLVFIGFIILIVVLQGGTGSNQQKSTIPLVFTKSGPAEVPNKTAITYTLSANYPGRASDVVIADTLSPDVEIVDDKTTKPYIYDSAARTVTWSTRQLQSGTATPSASPAISTGSVDVNKYTQPPFSFPVPNGASDITYSETVIQSLNELGSFVAKHQSYLITKVKNNNPIYVDPFLTVIWSGAIEGTGGNQFSWNCLDRRSKNLPDNPNLGCIGGFTSGGWQVGPGIQVSQATSHLEADFNAVYGAGSANNPQQVAAVGQKVINDSASSKDGQITNPRTFPSESISSLITKARGGDTPAQQTIAILLMDKELGAVSIAQEIAGDIASRDNWRATMEGWGSYYVSNMSLFSNRMQKLAQQYTGASGGSGSYIGSRSVTLTVRPTKDDIYVINTSTATVTGAGGSMPTGNIAQFLPNPLPADAASATAYKERVINHFRQNQATLFPIYQKASQASGLPWQVFAGLHWREGDATPGTSLTSGRKIGNPEPDRAAAGDCTGPVGTVDGIADINCVFASPEDDALFAGKFLSAKIGKTPTNFQELASAFSRYNGTGNTNCGSTAYPHCPPAFEGEDSPYALNWFDEKHSIMYLRYCSDGTPCPAGTQDQRPGTLTVMKWVATSF